MKKIFAFTALLLAGSFFGIADLFSPAFAAEPHPLQLGLQEAASPIKERIQEFHELLLIIIFGISFFVLLLLVYVIFRYNKHANKTPSRVTHNWLLEIVWTAIPLGILVIIVIPSMSLLHYLDRTKEPDMTLKTIGYQWGWTYQYPDHDNIEFNADMIIDEDMDSYVPNGRRLLETYNPVVVPIKKNIQVHVTAQDVIHSWAMPAFGVKKDAIPGRLNETWFYVDRPGVYFGQCSEICGIKHAYMPISVYAVPEDEFNDWVECVKNDSDSLFPARACVKSLDLDKYRSKKQLASAE